MESSIASAEELIADALRLLQEGRRLDAIALWKRALELDPANPRALDYLESTEANGLSNDSESDLDPQQPIEQERIPGLADKQAVLVAVKNREYDRALQLLYYARRQHPGDESISRSIQHIKARLARDLIAQLGDLDRVPKREEIRVPPGDLEAEVVATLIDGIVTLGDLIETSPLGRFRTLRVLKNVLGGAIAQQPTSAESNVAHEPSSSFDELFREATRLYLRGDLRSARAAFEKCAALRPEDPAVQHNLTKLRERGGS